MSHSHPIKIITPATPGLLTRLALAEYLDVDDGTIAGIAQRFGLESLEGHFPERAIWRQILGLEPESKEAEDLLREQLQDINWLARVVGRVQSTIRANIKAGTFAYSCGVQLGEVATERAFRGRCRHCHDRTPYQATQARVEGRG